MASTKGERLAYKVRLAMLAPDGPKSVYVLLAESLPDALREASARLSADTTYQVAQVTFIGEVDGPQERG